MYSNELFDQIYAERKSFKSEKICTLLDSIKTAYDELSNKFEYYTKRYQDAVTAILNQFPLKISRGIDGKIIFVQDGMKLEDVEDIFHSLKDYYDKFDSFKYLDFLAEENRNVVFVGPNGCGKTTLLRKLKQDTEGASIYYFPADRVLLVNNDFTPNRDYKEFLDDLKNSYNYSTDIDYTYQHNHVTKQFDYMLELLQRERNEENERALPNKVTDKIINEWHELVKDRELFFEHGLQVRPIGGKKYPLKYLSSGEKTILFLLIGILLQEKSDFYFIDEPENNLNPAIVSKLWNFIERERPDSIFVYLTHDSDFVASRINAKLYWIEKYDGTDWKWQRLPENRDLPQQLMVELVGNREPIIFCESENDDKYDAKLFKLMFPDFKIVSSGGCDKVRERVKAYISTGLPQKAYGIIDCDYRADCLLDGLRENGIYHLPYFEIENLLISECILKPMIETYSNADNKEAVISDIKNKVRELFSSQKEEWITKHVAFDLRDKFDYRGKIRQLTNIEQFKALYKRERLTDENIDKLYKEYEDQFNDIIGKNDYDLFLRHLDCKGFLSQHKHIFHFEPDILYEKQVFVFLNSPSGDTILHSLKEKYLSDIIK